MTIHLDIPPDIEAALCRWAGSRQAAVQAAKRLGLAAIRRHAVIEAGKARHQAEQERIGREIEG